MVTDVNPLRKICPKPVYICYVGREQLERESLKKARRDDCHIIVCKVQVLEIQVPPLVKELNCDYEKQIRIHCYMIIIQ